MKSDILWLTYLVFGLSLGSIQANLPKVCFAGLSCVLGRHMSNYDGYLFETFLGIPYAKPPIGDLRFSNPEEAELWNGTLPALYPKPDCIQRDYFTISKEISGSEDCLYLNIYRPLQSGGRKLPVMFYIHGGAFFKGSPSPKIKGPQYFMVTNDVILVVPAYRLGPFGFLSTNDTAMTGNYGLKDQRLALKWVNKYISAFGGDPDRVTIFGHSAGAVSVHFHILNREPNKNLFENAIMMSGVVNSPLAQPFSDPRGIVVKWAKAAGVSEAENLSSADLVQSLRSIKAKTLLQAVDGLKVWDVHPLVLFLPNIEDPTWPDAFLTNKQNIHDGRIPFGTSNDVNWIVGHVPAKGEGVVIADQLAIDKELQKEFNSKFNETVSLLLYLPAKCNQQSIIDMLVTEYMDGRYEINNDTINGFLELLGDDHFVYPTYTFIRNNVNSTRTDFKGIIYFNYLGPYSSSKSGTNFGPVHGSDSMFLFYKNSQPYLKISPEAALVRRYVRLYQNFATTGNADIKQCSDVEFPKNCEYLLIENDDEDPFKTGSTWNTERMAFWDKLYSNC